MDNEWTLAQERLAQGDAMGALRDFLRFEAEGLCRLESRHYPQGLRRLVPAGLAPCNQDDLLVLGRDGSLVVDLTRPGQTPRPPPVQQTGAYTDAWPLPPEPNTNLPRLLLAEAPDGGQAVLRAFRYERVRARPELCPDRAAPVRVAGVEALCCRSGEVLAAIQDGRLQRFNARTLVLRASYSNPLPLSALVPGPGSESAVGVGRDRGLCRYTFAGAEMEATPFASHRRFRAVAIGDLRGFGVADIVAVTRGGGVLVYDVEGLGPVFEASVPDDPLALCCLPGEPGDRVLVGGASGTLYALAVNERSELVQTQAWYLPHRITHLAALRWAFPEGDNRALAVGLETGEVQVLAVPGHRALKAVIEASLRALRRTGPGWVAGLLADQDPRVPAYALARFSGDLDCRDLSAFLAGIGLQTPALPSILGGLKTLLDRHRDRCHVEVGDAAFALLGRLSEGSTEATLCHATCGALADIVNLPGLGTQRAQDLLLKAQGRRDRFLVLRPRLRGRLLQVAALPGHEEEAEQIVEALETHRLDLMATATGSGRVVGLALTGEGAGPVFVRAEGDCGALTPDLAPAAGPWSGVDAVLALPAEAGGGCLLFRGREALRLGPDLAKLARFPLTAPITTACLAPGSGETWVAAAGDRALYGGIAGQVGEVRVDGQLVAIVAPIPGPKAPVFAVSVTGALYRLDLAPGSGKGDPRPLPPWYHRIEPPINALRAIAGGQGEVLVIGARGLVLLRGLPAKPHPTTLRVPESPVCAVRLPGSGEGGPRWLVSTRDRGLRYLDGALNGLGATHLDDTATALACTNGGFDGPRLYVGCARGNILSLDLLGPEAIAEVHALGDRSLAWSAEFDGLPCPAQMVLVRLAATEAGARPGADALYQGLDPRIRALISPKAILSALMTLQGRGLILVEGDARYRFRSEAMRRWVAARHRDPFDVVRTHARDIVAAWTLADIARVQEAANACATPHWPGEAFGIDPTVWARAARLAERRRALDAAPADGRLPPFAAYIEALAGLIGASVSGHPEARDPGPYLATIAFPEVKFQGFGDIRVVFPAALRDPDLPEALRGVVDRAGHLLRILVVLPRGGHPQGLADAAAPAGLALMDEADLAAVALSPDPGQGFLDRLTAQIDIAALSPFQTRGPVRETFHGREAQRHRILSYVLRKEGRGCAVIGPRRIGKTSLLQRVQDELRLERGIEVHYLDASPYGTDLGGLLRAILNRLGVTAGPVDGAGFLAALRERGLATPRRLALFIDEIDALAAADASHDSPFLNTLRTLTNELGVAVVLAGYEVLYDQMKDLSSPLFNMLEPIELGRLEDAAALALVADPLRHVYRIENALVQELVTRAGLYPNFIQIACAFLIARKGAEGDRTIRRDDIQQVMQSRDLFDHMVEFYLANLDKRHRAVLFLLVSLYDTKRGAFVVSPEHLERTLKGRYTPLSRSKSTFSRQFTPYDLHRILELHGVSLDPSEMQSLLGRLVLASVIAPVPDTKAYGFTLPDLPLILRRHVEVEEQAVHYAEQLVELFRPSPTPAERSRP